MKPTIDTEQDVAGLAKDLELAAELLRKSGLRALRTTHNWVLGPKSPNLDPNAGGWRYEDISAAGEAADVVPVPADTTGEAILRPDTAGQAFGRLSAALKFLATASDEVITVVRMACPSPAALRSEDLTYAQISAAGWCVSCHRDNGYCEPVAVRPNGQRRYRDFCNWCGEWGSAQNGRKPPLRLVELRHQGKRITERMVKDALEAEAAERRDTKKARKGKKAKAA